MTNTAVVVVTQRDRQHPQRRKKKRLTGIGVAVGAMSPIRPNVIRAMDFQFDTTVDGRTLKTLNVIDESTRGALAIDVDRGIDADGVVDVLDRLALIHGGAPHYVRFDNGPEFVAHAVHDWCRFNGTGSLFIDPGSPWRNAWIESFNGRLRDELLNSWHFDSLWEARVIIEDWRADYNTNRPHTAHGERTPTEFALQWTTTHQPQAGYRLDHQTGPLQFDRRHDQTSSKRTPDNVVRAPPAARRRPYHTLPDPHRCQESPNPN